MANATVLMLVFLTVPLTLSNRTVMIQKDAFRSSKTTAWGYHTSKSGTLFLPRETTDIQNCNYSFIGKKILKVAALL